MVVDRPGSLALVQAAIAGHANPIVRLIVASAITRKDSDGIGSFVPVIVWRLTLGRVTVERDEILADTDATTRAFLATLFLTVRNEYGVNQ